MVARRNSPEMGGFCAAIHYQGVCRNGQNRAHEPSPHPEAALTPLTEFFKDLTLPTMPAVAHDLIRSLNEDDVPLTQLRQVIEEDPALAVQLLRLANSAAYAHSPRVGRVEDAIARLGMGQVRSLALASMFNDAFPVAPGLEREAFWRASQSCGSLAQWIASGIGSDSEEAWLTGFMVRLGELLMGMKVPGCVQAIEKQPQYPGARWERELALLGFTEGELSAELARAWNFPDTMVHALQTAAQPLTAQPFSALGAVLHVAELLNTAAEAGEDAVQAVPDEVLQALSLDIHWMRNHLPQAQRGQPAPPMQ
jgi:HD-like signal output (HDOD) protein